MENSLRKVIKYWLIDIGFRFDKTKVPLFDIPNIDGFELKPYIDFNAPKLN
jgi:hypothetical protein